MEFQTEMDKALEASKKERGEVMAEIDQLLLDLIEHTDTKGGAMLVKLRIKLAYYISLISYKAL